MKITKVDVVWNFIATFFKIASSAILLPLILKRMSADDVGIWAVFSSVSALVFLIDFGFNSSFSRNVTYIFSGVNKLKNVGYEKTTSLLAGEVNYPLLKGILHAMRWFYSRVSLILLGLLSTVGTYYIHTILRSYKGNVTTVYVAWFLFCLISTYNLYTLYYDALLEGKGLIKRSKKIIILGHLSYIFIASITIYFNYGLVSLVLAQLVSILTIRVISHRSFFTDEIVGNLKAANEENWKPVLQAIYPNALKYGLTSLGGFMIQKSSIFIGSVFLTLSSIASFGISKQLIDITVAVANISVVTYLPLITKLRVESSNQEIKRIYLKGIFLTNAIFVLGTTFIIVFGQTFLSLIKSNTPLLDRYSLIVVVISSFIGLNSGVAGAIISTKNEIPFVKPSIYSGIATPILLLLIFKFTNLGLLGMALAPGLIDLCYQGWKWPLVVIRDLKITWSDVFASFSQFAKSFKKS